MVNLLHLQSKTKTEKRIVGGEDNFQVQPIKYPLAWQAYQNLLKNFWVPGEIAMGEDALGYQSLSENEAHMFTHVFMTLSAMDAFAAARAVDNIKGHITSPEHNQFLCIQVSNEAVHTETYALGITMLKLDEDYIWNGWRNIPAINDKIKFSQEMLSGLDNNLDLTKEDDIKVFLTAYFFFAGIFEGVWFYNGFSPIFALTNFGAKGAGGLPPMKRMSEQLEYILRDEAAHYGFGLNTISEIINETGVHPDKQTIINLCNEAIKLEEAYAAYVIPAKLGYYSAVQHVTAAKYYLNKRAQRVFNYTIWEDVVENPIGWLEDIVTTRKEKNFFESRVTEYQAGGLEWEGVSSKYTIEELARKDKSYPTARSRNSGKANR
jgi:ribonucleoside-diphosphate reductase beta chain